MPGRMCDSEVMLTNSQTCIFFVKRFFFVNSWNKSGDFLKLFFFSCVPNCRVVQLQAKPNQSYCLALNPIQSGEELRISYVNLLMPTYMRRRHLAENWYFDCICERYFKFEKPRVGGLHALENAHKCIFHIFKGAKMWRKRGPMSVHWNAQIAVIGEWQVNRN